MSYSPLTPLDDRIAVVTGGARGIGFEAARALRENGAKIVIVDINRELGEKAAKEFEGDYFAVDLTKPDQVAKLANDIVSKAAVIMLTKSLAGEWAKRGVRVNSVSPGYIGTEMTKAGMSQNDWYKLWLDFTPMGRVGEPREVATAVVFLASDASSYFTGSNLVMDGGYTIW